MSSNAQAMSDDMEQRTGDQHDQPPTPIDPEDVQRVHKPEHDEFEMPPNSIAPIIVAAGMLLTGVGIIAPLIGVVGVVVTLFGVLKMATFPTIDFHPNFFKQLNDRKFGMWTFITSEVMFFTALIGTFIAFKVDHPDEFAHAHEILSLPLATLGTTILIVSSFAVVMALEALQSNDRKVFFNWAILTAVFGIMFLGIQAFEWYELFHEGIDEKSIFGTTFFTTTGFHGLHVTGGVVWLLLLLRHAWAHKDFGAENALSLELFGLYWHFVDVVWIVLFTVIYLIE